LHPSDTNVGSAGSSSASKQTLLSGGAVQAACAEIREELHRRAARGADPLGRPIDRTAVYRPPATQALGENGQGDAYVCFAFAAQRAVVDVDAELGLV